MILSLSARPRSSTRSAHAAINCAVLIEVKDDVVLIEVKDDGLQAATLATLEHSKLGTSRHMPLQATLRCQGSAH